MVTKGASKSPAKKLAVKKDKVKDLNVKGKKGSDVKGGAQRYNPSQKKTAIDPNCPC